MTLASERANSLEDVAAVAANVRALLAAVAMFGDIIGDGDRGGEEARPAEEAAVVVCIASGLLRGAGFTSVIVFVGNCGTTGNLGDEAFGDYNGKAKFVRKVSVIGKQDLYFSLLRHTNVNIVARDTQRTFSRFFGV